jgi:uncharacterized membrane protein YhhN
MRWIWWAAIAAGVSFFFADEFGASGAIHVIWKGAGVGLLALWAETQARSPDGWLLAVVLALGAVGDVLLETHGLTIGAIAFLAGHILAIALYLRNRRANPSGSQTALALALLIGTPLISWLLTRDAGVALYATGLGAMAAAAWVSRFPRYRLGLGAVLFVISDLLIFARSGPLAGSAIPDLLVWPTYFAGQALIATAGVSALRPR